MVGSRLENGRLDLIQNSSSGYTVGVDRLTYNRKPGRPWKNWMDVVKRDLKDMDVTCEEAEELAEDRAGWRKRVDQCTQWSMSKSQMPYNVL